MKIYGQVRLGVTPEINAACTILIAIVSVGVIATSIVNKRREVQRRRDEQATMHGGSTETDLKRNRRRMVFRRPFLMIASLFSEALF